MNLFGKYCEYMPGSLVLGGGDTFVTNLILQKAKILSGIHLNTGINNVYSIKMSYAYFACIKFGSRIFQCFCSKVGCPYILTITCKCLTDCTCSIYVVHIYYACAV